MKLSVQFVVLFLLVVPGTILAKDASDLHTVDVKVARVSDGDTLELVDPLPGFAHGDKIRILGIQALEENDDTSGIPDCNATNATDRLAELLGCDLNDNCPAQPTVTLKVWDENLENKGRPWRYVFFDDGSSGEKNLGLQLVEEGYVLAFSHPDETLYNETLWRAQENAIANEIGPLWNSSESQCAVGTGSGTQLEMWVNWDAPGDDSLPENRNGEWVKIRNNGSATVDLSYWKLRDTGQQHPYEFPAGADIPAGETVTVYVGAGVDSSTSYYMDQSSAVFENFIPEGAYLFDYWGNHDRPGEIRASFTYPCLSNCSDSLQGDIKLTANYDADGVDDNNPNGEWVDIKNTSSRTVNMEMYLLHSDPVGSDTFSFDDNSKIYSGETMRIYIGQGTSSRLKKYWGNSSSILANSKDRVWVDTYDSIQIAEYSWPVSEVESRKKVVMAPILYLLSR